MHIHMCTKVCKCVCVSVLFCTLQKLPEWMVWHTLGLLVMPKDLICLAVGQGWLAQDYPPLKGAVSPVSVPMVGHTTYYHGSLWVCVFRPLPGLRATLNSASPLPAPVESAEAPVNFLLVVCLYLRAHLFSLASYLKS